VKYELLPTAALLSLVANWGLPLAAFADAQDTPEKISGKMTTGDMCLSAVFHFEGCCCCCKVFS